MSIQTNIISASLFQGMDANLTGSLIVTGSAAVIGNILNSGSITIQDNLRVGVYESGWDGVVHIGKDSLYTDWLNPAFAISTTDNPTPALFIGADSSSNLSFIQSWKRGESYDTVPLSLQPNGGKVGIGIINPIYNLNVSGSVGFTGGLDVTGSLNISGSLTVNNSTVYVSSSNPSFAATTGSIYIDTPTQKISTKISSGSEWEGVNYRKINYLTYDGAAGTATGTNGCHLVSPGTWSLSEYNSAYYIDDSLGVIQVIIPDADANNAGKEISLNKPRAITSNNYIQIVTSGSQKISSDTSYYLRSSNDRAIITAVPWTTAGASGYQWRQISSKQNTRQEISVGNHGTNFSKIYDAVNFFNSYSIDDCRITIKPGTYTESPITINNTSHSLIIMGDASTAVDIIPSSSCYSQSLFTIKSSCDFNRFKVNGNDLPNYGSLNTEHLIDIQDNNYHEFKDIFLYGGYNGINITSSYDPEVYLLDSEFAHTTGSGIRVEGGEVESRVVFFEDNNIGVNLVTGSVYFSTIASEFYVPAGKTGILYNSASTTIDTFSVLSSEFTGAGTYLSGSNYSQAHDANIKISGNTNLSNNNPFAFCSFRNNTSTTQSLSAGRYQKVPGTNFIATPAQKFSVSNNRLTYLAEVTKSMLVTATGNVLTTAGNNQTIGVAIVKNNNSASFMYSDMEVRTTTAGQPYNFANQAIVTMAKNDYVELWIANYSSTTNQTTAQDMQLIVREI